MNQVPQLLCRLTSSLSGGIVGCVRLITLLLLLLHPALHGQEVWQSHNIGIPLGGQQGQIPVLGMPWLEVHGGGTGIGGVLDSFHLACPQSLMLGNIEVEARVDFNAMRSQSPNTEGGVMLRQSIASNSAFVCLVVTPLGDVKFKWRNAPGYAAAESFDHLAEGSPYIWLRLVRSGGFVAGYQSADGVNWSMVGSAVFLANSVELTLPFQTGICVTSQDSQVLAEMTFDNFKVLPWVPQKVTPIKVGTTNTTAAIKLWLRADWNVSRDQLNRVSFWEDQSGYANDATSTAQNSPILVDNFVGGKPALHFPAATAPADRKFMTVQSHESLSSTISGQGGSLFVVARWALPQATMAGIVSKSTAATTGYFLGFNAGLPRFRVMGTLGSWSATPALDLSASHLLCGEYSHAGKVRLWIDGLSPAAAGSGTNVSLSATSTPLHIGQFLAGTTAYPFVGHIAEVLMFDKVLDDETRCNVEQYFRAKYNLPMTVQPPAAPVVSITSGVGATSGILSGDEDTGRVAIIVPEGALVYYRINNDPNKILYTSPFLPAAGTHTVSAWVEKPGYPMGVITNHEIIVDPDTSYVARSGLKLWLRGDAGVTKTVAGLVSTWKSQATNAVLEAKSNSPHQPLWSASGSHGQPVVSFPTGALSRLAVAGSPALDLENGHTLYVIAKPSAAIYTGSTNVITALLSRSGVATGSNLGYQLLLRKESYGGGKLSLVSRIARAQTVGGTTNSTYEATSATALPANGVYLPDSGWSVLSSRVTPSTWDFRINTKDISQSWPNGLGGFAKPASDLLLGASLATGTPNHFFSGEIAEVLVYDRALTSKEFKELEAYCADRYNLQDKPSLNFACNIPSGTYSAPVPLAVTFTSMDDASISYRVHQDGAWSEWSNAATGRTDVSLGSGVSEIKTFIVEAKAEKNRFPTTTLSRTLTIDPSSSDIPRTNLKLWLRADVGVTADAESNVSAWKDQSGAGNDLVASETERPLLSLGTLGVSNSISFGSGTSVSRMTAANQASFNLGALPDNDWSVYAVVRPSSTTGRSTLVEHSTDAAIPKGFLLQLEQTTTGLQKLFGQMLPNAGVSSTTPDYQLSQAFHLFSQQIRPVGNPAVLKHSLQINRAYVEALDVQQTVSNDNQLRIFSLGARRSVTSPERWIGDISELLIYDKPLSATELGALEACLIRRHGLASVQQKPALALPSATPDRGCWKPGVAVSFSHPLPGVGFRHRHWRDGELAGSWNVGSTPITISSIGLVNVEIQAFKSGYEDSQSLKFRLDIDASVVALPRNHLTLWLRGDKGIEGEAPQTPTSQSRLLVKRWKDQSGGKNYLETVAGSLRPTGGDSALMSVRGNTDPGQTLPASVVKFPHYADVVTDGPKMQLLHTDRGGAVGQLFENGSKIFMVCRFNDIGAGRPTYSHRTIFQVVNSGNEALNWCMFAYVDGGKQWLGVSSSDQGSSPLPNLLFNDAIADRVKPHLVSTIIGGGYAVFPGLMRTGTESAAPWSSSVVSSHNNQIYLGGNTPITFEGAISVVRVYGDPNVSQRAYVTNVSAVDRNRLAKGMRINSAMLDKTKTHIANPKAAAGVELSKPPVNIQTSIDFTAYSYMEGEIAELLVYDNNLTLEDEAKIKEYLLGRYVFDAQKPFAPPVISPAVTVLRQGAVVTITPPSGTGVFRVNGVEHPADQPHTLTVAEGQTRLLVKAEAEPINKGYSPSEAQAVFVIDPNAELVTKSGLKLWIRGDTVVTQEASNSVESWLDGSGNGRHLKAAALTGATAPQVFEHPPASGTALVLNGAVTTVSVTNGGAGYLLPPSVKLIGGGGSGASASAQITNGVVTSVTVNSGGTGYIQAPAVLFSAPFNGQPYVRFRALNNNVLQTFSEGLDGGKLSVFAVLRRTTTNSPLSTRIAGSYFLPSGASSSPEGFSLQLTTDTANTTFALRSSGLVSHQLPSVFGRPEDQGILFVGCSYDGSTAQLFERGTQVKTGSLSAIGLTESPFYVGGNNVAADLNADLAELLVYDRALTKDEVDNLTVYVQERYGIDVLKKVPAPVPSHFGGTYSAPVPLRFKSLMPGCTVRYVVGPVGQPLSTLADPSLDPPDGNSVVFNLQDVSSFITVSGGSRCVKVRAFRDGFLPSDVVSLEYHFDSSATFNREGLALWLRADKGVIEAAGKIARWRDQSGLNNDAIGQENAAHRPQLVSGIGGLSGPVVRFGEPGSTLPIRLEVPNHASLNTGAMTMIAVARKTGPAGTVSSTLAKKGGFTLNLGGTATLPLATVTTAPSLAINSGQFNVVTGSVEAPLKSISNGVTTATASSGVLAIDALPLFIGNKDATTSTAALQGEIAELLVFNRGLSVPERQEVELYLNSRFGGLLAPSLSPPSSWPVALSETVAGGTHFFEAPDEVGMYGPAGATIYWTTNPTISRDQVSLWNVYRQPLPVYYTTTFRAFCRIDDQPPRVSPVVKGTFTLDPIKYPAPQYQAGDNTPPVITLEKPIRD